MRKIKFRCWDKNGMFNYGQPIMHDDAEEMNIWQCMVNDKDFVMMQYTGVKDENGREIYEGDIVKFGSEFYEVIFDSYMFNLKDFYCPCFDYPGDAFSEITQTGNFEVIGNIYENLELLKEV